MATAKKTPAGKKRAAAKTPAAPRSVTLKPHAGKAKAGVAWEPDAPEMRSMPGEPEVIAPRPRTTTRYPIPQATFDALKSAAPKAKLKATSATVAKDGPPKRGAAARSAPGAAAPGQEPSAAPVATANFAGLAATGWLPPDCTLAVGPAHALVAVNSSMAVYNKTGGAALLKRTLTQWFANVVQGMTIFDPKALYDQHAGRWVLMAVAVKESAPKASLHLVSISAAANPLGQWRNYRFDAMRDGNVLTNNWADYPTLGVDNQALYIGSNMFAFGGGFAYAKVRVIPKAGPYAGGAAPYFDFTKLKNADNSLAFTVQPCHTFGAPQVEYLVNTPFPSGNTLTVWRIVNGGTVPSLTRTQVAISAFSLPPNADQAGGAPPLNTGDVRALHAVFRGGSVWAVFTTAHNWGGANNRAAIQWCQVNPAVPALVQQGVYGAASFHYYYPAACADGNGNMTMVFSRSGPNEFGSVLYTGRRSTDPLGSLQGSAMLKAGLAHYKALDSGGRNRWGDYAGVAADPVDARKVWFYSEYASAINTWGTWVGSAVF